MIAGIVLLVVSVLFLFVGARGAVAARLAWRGVADDERAQVVLLLEDAERRCGKAQSRTG